MPGVQPAMKDTTKRAPPSIAKDHPWVVFDTARFMVVEARAIGPTLSTYRQVVMKAKVSDDGADERIVTHMGPDCGSGGEGRQIAEQVYADVADIGSIEPWGFHGK